MHEFYYDYMKPKYGEKAKLCLQRQLHLHRHCKNVKQDLILEIMNDKDHYQNEKIQNNWINER